MVKLIKAILSWCGLILDLPDLLVLMGIGVPTTTGILVFFTGWLQSFPVAYQVVVGMALFLTTVVFLGHASEAIWGLPNVTLTPKISVLGEDEQQYLEIYNDGRESKFYVKATVLNDTDQNAGNFYVPWLGVDEHEITIGRKDRDRVWIARLTQRHGQAGTLFTMAVLERRRQDGGMNTASQRQWVPEVGNTRQQLPRIEVEVSVYSRNRRRPFQEVFSIFPASSRGPIEMRLLKKLPVHDTPNSSTPRAS